MPIAEQSKSSIVPAVGGENTADGDGVFGKGRRGVVGVGENAGVVGESEQFDGVFGVAKKSTTAGVSGHNEAGGYGVFGESKNGGCGLAGLSDSFHGVHGHSNTSAGVFGESEQFDGVFGVAKKSTTAGVSGHNETGTAVWGDSKSGRGVAGFSESWQGVYGHSAAQAGVVGESDRFVGVWAESHEKNQPALLARNAVADGRAGHFEGNVTVTGDITLTNADCAEDFDVSDETPAVAGGTVMVLGDDGMLRPCQRAYDKRVAGVISGAGQYKAGIVLDKQKSGKQRRPIALLGKVFCKVDAHYGNIETGDLLTTSPTFGYAMKAVNPLEAFGSVIGKALRPQLTGKGMIPILIALQ